jgi:hypothetical protein
MTRSVEVSYLLVADLCAFILKPQFNIYKSYVIFAVILPCQNICVMWLFQTARSIIVHNTVIVPNGGNGSSIVLCVYLA